jgi:hypothetical protein
MNKLKGMLIGTTIFVGFLILKATFQGENPKLEVETRNGSIPSPAVTAPAVEFGDYGLLLRPGVDDFGGTLNDLLKCFGDATEPMNVQSSKMLSNTEMRVRLQTKVGLIDLMFEVMSRTKSVLLTSIHASGSKGDVTVTDFQNIYVFVSATCSKR